VIDSQSHVPFGAVSARLFYHSFLYIGLSRDGKYQYLLLLKDDLYGYLGLVPCRTADAAATVDALMRWFSVFGLFGRAVTDIGQRQPLQERSCTTSAEGTQGQASFHNDELPVATDRHNRVRMQASHTCFPCSAVRAEDVRIRVARSGSHVLCRPDQCSRISYVDDNGCLISE
jgi:hypothetical protein